MKVDIEGSEHFLCDTGHKVFDYLEIPVIQMEWQYVRKYKYRADIVLDFFTKRDYIPTIDMCQKILLAEAFRSWPWEIYWIKLNSSNIC